MHHKSKSWEDVFQSQIKDLQDTKSTFVGLVKVAETYPVLFLSRQLNDLVMLATVELEILVIASLYLWACKKVLEPNVQI